MRRNWDLVVFDLDGTLLDSSAWLLQAVNEVLAPYVTAPWTHEDLIATAGGPEREVFGRIVPASALDGVLRAYGEALRAPGSLRPKTGVEEVLQSLERAGTVMAVFSGAGTALGMLRLSLVGWENRFPVCVWGDQTRPKPAPDGLWRAIERAGVDKSRTLFVGDTEKDSECARAAGVRFLGVAWGDRPGGPPHCDIAATPAALLSAILTRV